MRLIYNNTELKILVLKECSRESIYSDDLTTYLWDKWTISVQAVYNPQATAYALGVALQAGGGAVASPTPTPGTPAATTDLALLDALKTERAQLQVLMGTVLGGEIVLLQSPAGGFTVDAHNGPLPQVHGIRQNTGDKTFIVDFTVTTFVNRAQGLPFGTSSGVPGNRRPIALTHRWRMILDTNEDFLTTRIVDGILLLRSDDMVLAAVNPDQFRIDCFHPLLLNCKRENIRVVATEDGTSLRYHFEDRELPLNLALGQNSPISRIEAYETDWQMVPSPLQVAYDANIEGVGAIAGLFGGGIQGIAGAISQGFKTTQRMLPQSYKHWFVRVWGSRQASRVNDCLATAFAIIAGRLTLLNVALTVPSVECSVTQDLLGKFVEVQVTLRRGANPATLLSVFVPGWLAFFNADEHINANGTVIVTPDDAVNPAPPNSGATRGTLVAQCLAQALQTPRGTPAAPANVTNTDQHFR